MGYLEAQLPTAPAYGGSIFLSYARADDEKPPFEDAVHGWVTFFWNQLRFELTNAGVHQAKLWLDRYEIEPSEEFTEKIEAALREARLIVPILSPNWVQRPWCLKEIDRFCELHARRVGANDDTVALVVKREPLADAIPELLKNREGYRQRSCGQGPRVLLAWAAGPEGLFRRAQENRRLDLRAADQRASTAEDARCEPQRARPVRHGHRR